MRSPFVTTFIALVLISFNCWKAYALTIISPKEGQVVYQGDKLPVIVKPDAGEKWEEVLFYIFPMRYNMLTGRYEEEIEIPKDEIGNVDFTILAYDKTGREVKLIRTLFVKMPSNVVLQSILVDDYKTLFKLPSGSSLEDIQRIESRQLYVRGIYSDGVKRTLTSSATGTSYTSSDEKVVTVNSDGKMTAQGIGTAKIIVRNGSLSAEVKVIVKPYKK